MEFTCEALICGVREIQRRDKPPLYFLDWYAGGAKASIIDREQVSSFRDLSGQRVKLHIRVEESEDRVYYRILGVMAVTK